jgi:hypothetical protein
MRDGSGDGRKLGRGDEAAYTIGMVWKTRDNRHMIGCHVYKEGAKEIVKQEGRSEGNE